MFGRILRSIPAIRRVGLNTPKITTALRIDGAARLTTALRARLLTTQTPLVEPKPPQTMDWAFFQKRHQNCNIVTLQQNCYTLGIVPTQEHFHKLDKIAERNPEAIHYISKIFFRLSRSDINLSGQYFDRALTNFDQVLTIMASMVSAHKPLLDIILGLPAFDLHQVDSIMRLNASVIAKLNQIIKTDHASFASLISSAVYITPDQFEKLAEILFQDTNKSNASIVLFVIKEVKLPISSVIDVLYKHRDKINGFIFEYPLKRNLRECLNRKPEERAKAIDLLIKAESLTNPHLVERFLRECPEGIDIIASAAESPQLQALHDIYFSYKPQLTLAQIIEKKQYAEDILKFFKLADNHRQYDAVNYVQKVMFLILNKAAFLNAILKLVETSKLQSISDLVVFLNKAELANDMVRIISQAEDTTCEEYVNYFKCTDIEILRKVIAKVDAQTRMGLFTPEFPLTSSAFGLIVEKFEEEAHEQRAKDALHARRIKLQQQEQLLKEQQKKEDQSVRNKGLGAVALGGGLYVYSLYAQGKRESAPISLLGTASASGNVSIAKPGH